MFWTRAAYAPAIRAAADVWDQFLDLNEFDVAILAAIAYHQPITLEGLKDIFGREISRDLIGRPHARGLIGTGPRAPRRGRGTLHVCDNRAVPRGLRSGVAPGTSGSGATRGCWIRGHLIMMELSVYY